MRQGIQSFMKSAGDYACYALCLIEIAQRYLKTEPLDSLHSLLEGVDAGFIKYNWSNPLDTDNFFVTDPAAFLKLLTGVKWAVRNVKDKPTSPYYVEYWVWKLGHFKLPDWNSLTSSASVNNGKIESYRECVVL